MGWEDSNLRMTESKSVDLPTCRHPNKKNCVDVKVQMGLFKINKRCNAQGESKLIF